MLVNINADAIKFGAEVAFHAVGSKNPVALASAYGAAHASNFMTSGFSTGNLLETQNAFKDPSVAASSDKTRQ